MYSDSYPKGLGKPSATSLSKAASKMRIPLGIAEVDTELNGGLLACGLHEFYASAGEDSAAAISFALLLGQLYRPGCCPALVWAREAKATQRVGYPYGPGLAEIGIDTSRLTVLLLPDAESVLRAALEAARDAAVSAVVIELTGRQPLLDLTATRRFAFAAAEKDTMVLITRMAALPISSSAHSRWRVAASSSRALEAHAPGPPAFALELLRQRGGRDGLNFTMEWDRDNTSFRLRDNPATAPPLSGSRSALVCGGESDKRRSHAS